MKRFAVLRARSPLQGAAHPPPLIRHTLFWQLFANYFLLILIPVIAASVLAHVLVVRIIEQNAERFNYVSMSRFSEQTDTALQSLKTNMIHMLSASNLRSLLLNPTDESSDSQHRAEFLHSLRDQLQQLESDALVRKAYFYFVHEDLIIDAETYTNKSYYFTSRYTLDLSQRTELEADLTGKKMMDFIDSPAAITATMSYPFNTTTPDVYLLVEVQSDRLEEQIYIPESWVTGTAIIDETGKFISHTGLTVHNQQWLQQSILQDGMVSPFKVLDKQGLSFMKSGFDESWYYVSIIDLGTLMKPAYLTRIISWLFCIFFLLVGGLVSYYLSRRLYRPIRDIKDGLRSHHVPGAFPQHEGNEFDVIKRYSQLIITENKELFQMVQGMQPIVQEYFVAKILLGEYRDALSIEYYAKQIEFAFDSEATRTVLCITFHYEPLSETTKSFLLIELKDKIQQSVPYPVWLSQTKPDMMACVVQHDLLSGEVPEQTADILKQTLLHQEAYYKATIGIGITVHAIEELHVSYEHASAVLKQRGLHSNVEICSGRPYRDPPQWDSFLSVQDVHRILNQYKTREYDMLLESVLLLLEEGKRRDATAVQIKYLCADVLNTWIRAVESEHNELNVPYYSSLFERMNRCMTWGELESCFKDIHSFLFRVAESSSRSQQFSVIVQYIHDHYDQELSIEYFAGMTKMSIGHFSRTFKEEVGEKYVEYIAKYRLMMAKQFLIETDMKIDDIAEKVGYWGRNSLIRAFRRYEGITPAKYRALHQ